MTKFSMGDRFQHAGITPLDPDRTYDRGGGRRLPHDPVRLAAIPAKVRIGDTKATHELCLIGKTYRNGETNILGRCGARQGWDDVRKLMCTIPHNDDPRAQDDTEGTMLILSGKSTELGRGNGSKILRTHTGEYYAVMTWSDLFGMAIKECELSYSKKGVMRIYLMRLDAAQSAIADAAFTLFMADHGVI